MAEKIKDAADRAERYFAHQELEPITIAGARWSNPQKAVALHINQMRNSQEGSDVYEASKHHLQQYRDALSGSQEAKTIQEHTIAEKVAQMQKKSKSTKSLIGTECP